MNNCCEAIRQAETLIMTQQLLHIAIPVHFTGGKVSNLSTTLSVALDFSEHACNMVGHQTVTLTRSLDNAQNMLGSAAVHNNYYKLWNSSLEETFCI